MNKKIILLNQRPKNHIIILVFSLFSFIALMLLSCFYKIYDSYYLVGLISCEKECSIRISIPYNKVDILEQNSHIEYLNKAYKITSVEYGEPYLDNGIPYEDITLKTNLKSKDKIINFKILYNKQRIIKKIKKLMEGD